MGRWAHKHTVDGAMEWEKIREIGVQMPPQTLTSYVTLAGKPLKSIGLSFLNCEIKIRRGPVLCMGL